MTDEEKTEQSVSGNLIDCPDCQGMMAKSAVSCPHCGSTTYQQKILEEKVKAKKEQTSHGCLMIASVALGFFIIIVGLIALGSNQSSKTADIPSKSTPSSNRKVHTPKVNCYKIGYKYGLAATLVLKGLDPGPDGDITIPYECQDDPETDRGMAEGAATAW